MIHDGHLELVAEATAQETLSSDEAKEEVDIIRNQQRIFETLSATPEMVVGNEDMVDPARKKAQQAARTGQVESREPDAVIQQLVTRLKNEEITEGQANSTIRTMMSDLTKADITYILENLHKDKFPRVVNVVTEEAIRRGMMQVVEDSKKE
jgi:hypothetical protein